MQEYAYLFLGDNEVLKRNKIDSVKNYYLDKEFKDVDFEIIYSDDKDLSPPRFNEILSYFPANPLKKRIILIKNIECLSKNNKGILKKYFNKPCDSVLLLLDSAKVEMGDSFAKEICPFIKKFYFKSDKKLDVFDLAQAVTQHNAAYALKVLNLLLNSREKPQSILGGLFWQWDNIKDKLSLDKFKQGLNIFVDTDSKIKTGKMPEDLALEMLIIRLCSLV